MPDTASLDDLNGRPVDDVFGGGHPRTVRLALEAGDSLEPHRHPAADIVVHVLEGRIDLRLDDESYELGPGQLARFSGERDISPLAIDDAVALLVFG